MFGFERVQLEEALQDDDDEVIGCHVVIVDEDLGPRLKRLFRLGSDFLFGVGVVQYVTGA